MLTDRVAELTRPMGEEELLTVDYPTPRFQIDTRASIGAAVILALLAVGVLIHLSRDTPAPPQPPPAAPSSTTLAAPATSHPTQAADTPLDIRLVAGDEQPAPGTIVVSVGGAVARPGIVTLKEGARVADALQAAGPLPEADLVTLNQAQRLSDGVHIIIATRGEHTPTGQASGISDTTTPAPTGPEGQPQQGGAGININTADAATLETLPGIGAKTAAAILDHRSTVGPFSSVDELGQVKGIGPAKLAALRGRVTV